MTARVEVTLEPLQCGLQIGGVLIAEVTVLFECLPDDPAQLVRERGIYLICWCRIAIQYRVKNHGRSVTLKWQRTRRHLIQDRPERKYVRPRIRYLTACLLGRH